MGGSSIGMRFGTCAARVIIFGAFFVLVGLCSGCDDSDSQTEGVQDTGNENPMEDAGSHQATPDIVSPAVDSNDSVSPLDAFVGSVGDEGPQAAGDGGAEEGDSTSQPSKPPNILLIIADDLGVGASRCYDVGTDLAPTPNIQSLCDRGVVFENMWSAPICSPTRASIMTGRFSYRTGVGGLIQPGHPGLSLEEWSIPKVLDANPQLGYSHACIGKWHVGPAGNKAHPNDMGFEHFSGLLIGGVQSYTQWNETTDGETENCTEYATSRHVDRALTWLSEQQSPWFLWLALISPHTPFHLPPAELHSYGDLSGTEEDIEANPSLYYRAMIEAMDSEIGRLFAGIGEEELENTVVIYVGDNGPAQKAAEAPYKPNRAKGSLYQGGIHVPLMIAGPGIDVGPSRTPALAHVVDLYSTILDAAGANSSVIPSTIPIDGVSLWPLLDGSKTSVRDWVLAEFFGASESNKTGKAARDEQYKLINLDSGAQRFFDLDADPYEESPLDRDNLDAEPLSRYEKLRDLLESIPAN